MKRDFLQLVPERILCPYCGEWHDWDSRHELGYFDSDFYSRSIGCSNAPSDCNKGEYTFYFKEGYFYYYIQPQCGRGKLSLNGEIEIDSITESVDKPIVTFKVPFKPHEDVGSEQCWRCKTKCVCNLVRLADEGHSQDMKITLGFEFDPDDYNRLTKSDILARKECELQERENAVKGREQSLQGQETALRAREQSLDEREEALKVRERKIEQTRIKEETTMTNTTKKTSIKTQLYEHSPKENIEIVKAWAEKYKHVLKWAIPVAAVYGAYRILNSKEFDLSVNNISETCEKKLGFKLELLENKRALKELMALGGIAAGAYGAVNAVSGILGTQKEKDINVEELEAGMSQIESISKKFAWIQPKTEDLLPIAFSVILVYVTLHKPKFTGTFANKVRDITEDFRIKIDTYVELAKLFIQDNFNLDLSNEEEQRKLRICAFLVALMGIFAFMYGKKVLEHKATSEETGEVKVDETSKSVKVFIEQAKEIIKKIAPSVYTSLITMLVSKKILMMDESPELPKEEDVIDEATTAQNGEKDAVDEATASGEETAVPNGEKAEPEAPSEVHLK